MNSDLSSSQLAVAAIAPTLPEADLVCAVLGAAGIEAFVANSRVTNLLMHASLGLNPWGVQVLVRGQDAQEAEETLADLRNIPATEERDPPENVADMLARSAYCSAVFSLIVIIFVPLTFWYYMRAWMASLKQDPTDPRRFETHMKWSRRMIILLTAGLLAGAFGEMIAVLLSLGHVASGM